MSDTVGDLLGCTHPVHPADQHAVVVEQWTYLTAVHVESVRHRLRGVVRTTFQLGAPGEALVDLLLGDIQVQHDLNVPAVGGELTVQLSGLLSGPGVPVEDETVTEMILHDLCNHAVGNEVAAGDALRHTVRVTGPDAGTQQLPGGDVRHTDPVGKGPTERALTRSGWPQQDDPPAAGGDDRVLTHPGPYRVAAACPGV